MSFKKVNDLKKINTDDLNEILNSKSGLFIRPNFKSYNMLEVNYDSLNTQYLNHSQLTVYEIESILATVVEINRRKKPDFQYHAEFRNEDFTHLKLVGLRFDKSVLACADFSNSELIKCRFVNCDMRYVKIEHSLLRNCCIENCNMKGCIISSNTLIDQSTLLKNDMSKSDISDLTIKSPVNIQNVLWKSCKLYNININNCSIPGAIELDTKSCISLMESYKYEINQNKNKNDKIILRCFNFSFVNIESDKILALRDKFNYEYCKCNSIQKLFFGNNVEDKYMTEKEKKEEEEKRKEEMEDEDDVDSLKL